MVSALIIFLCIYALMLSFQKYRPLIALGGALLFVLLGIIGVYDFSLKEALYAVDYNVLLMISGTMGIVTLFIDSKMPIKLSEILISKVPNVKWAVTVLALFAGVISAFVDNVATVLMVAPVGIAISKKLNISPVKVIIAIAVSSNLQGAATLVGDTTSILLGGFANMNFFDFFWMMGKPGIFWGVELGALASCVVLLIIFRKEKQPIHADSVTKVEDCFPTYLIVGTVLLLIAASFIPKPSNGFALVLYNLRSGLICIILCTLGILRELIQKKNKNIVSHLFHEADKDTLAMLFGLFIIIEGIKKAGVIDAIAELFYRFSGNNAFLLYTLLVFVSVVLSAFVDNIPYVATMLPVVQSISSMLSASEDILPYVFYFGLLTGATLGGNLTPIGASANIAAIGLLKKEGYTVSSCDFMKIGVPFTIAAVLSGYVYIWAVWGV